MDVAVSAILIMGFIIIYAIIINIYTVIFRMTGLTKEKAKFQVISLLTNSGYTTSESEVITENKVRRNIARACMLTGYTFSVIIISLIINLILSLKKDQVQSSFQLICIAFGVFVAVIIVFQLPFVKKGFEAIIEKLTLKMLTGKNDNIITLLDNYGKDAIAEVSLLCVPDFMKNKSLFDCKIKDTYNINVLMVKRRGKILDVTKDTVVQNNDHIVVFGNYQTIKDLFRISSIDDVEEVLKEEKLNNVIDLLDNFGKDAMAEVTVNRVPECLIDTPLIESGIKTKYGINVIMLKRNLKAQTVSKDTVIKQFDKIVVFGSYQGIKDLFLFEEMKEDLKNQLDKLDLKEDIEELKKK